MPQNGHFQIFCPRWIYQRTESEGCRFEIFNGAEGQNKPETECAWLYTAGWNWHAFPESSICAEWYEALG